MIKFAERVDQKVRDKHGLGVVEILSILIVATLLVVTLIKWNMMEKTQENSVDISYLSPTAGITYYMSRLQYWSLQCAEPLEVEEPEVETVSIPEPVEAVPENNEDVVEYGLYNLTDHELLARIIYCECGNLGEEAMYAAGSVVLNRVKDPRFENTIKGVIFQTGQYAPTWDGNWEKFSEPSDVAWEIAEELLVYGTTIPENVVFQAQFVQGRGVYKQIGNQYFCY